MIPEKKPKRTAMPLFFFLALLFLNHPAEAAEPYPGKFIGPARVADGDSVWIGNEEMRFLCIDAVELHQECQKASGALYPCGVEAKEAMVALIGGAEISCFGHERDKYDRPLVYCRAHGIDLNKAIVEQGWAISTCPSFKNMATEAKRKKIGIWQGKFERPVTWRKKHPWKKEESVPKPQ